MDEAERFAEAIHERYPGKLLAYNCSPSFNWRKHLSDAADRGLPARARRARLPLPVRHPGRLPLAEPRACSSSPAATGRGDDAPTSALQEREFELEDEGYTATRHQREVGAGYFDPVMQAVTGGTSSTLALSGSTEERSSTERGAPHDAASLT